MAKQLPIRRVGTKVPPVFEWYQKIIAPNGANKTILQQGCVAVAMEKALCDLIAEAERLQAENERLSKENTRLNSVAPKQPYTESGPPMTVTPMQVVHPAPIAKKKGK